MYTAPTTRSDGDIITNDLFNTDVVDNITALNAVLIQRNTGCTQAKPTRLFNTIYQAGAKPLFVTVGGWGGGTIEAQVSDTTPPTTVVATAGYPLAAPDPLAHKFRVAFVVPAGYYYRVTPPSTGNQEAWVEWELF